MSGPKVVRIVTREEILAICENLLRQLDRAIAHWTTEGRRTGELSDAEVAATQARRHALAALVAQEAFMELQKTVRDEIVFLKEDLVRRERVAIDKAAQARKRQRHARENASSLLAALESRGAITSPSLQEQLQSIANGENLERADSILAQGFNLLIPYAPSGLSDAQRNLAIRLQDGCQEHSFEAWKAKRATSSPIDFLLERVDKQLAEAEAVLGAEQTAAYAQRVHAIQAGPNDARRALLLDSLILDLSSSIKTSRHWRTAQEQLEDLGAEVQALESEASASLLKRIAACDTSTPLELLVALTEECRTIINGALQSKAAQSRREAILKGLARLGYEVHEGMATSWAKSGRVVLRKPSMPGYGVEVGGQAESSRLQVRAVALSEHRDTSRDRDVETVWCGEFTRLQQLVAEGGNNLVIERAMGVGQVPLKIVGDMASTEHSSGLAKKRTL